MQYNKCLVPVQHWPMTISLCKIIPTHYLSLSCHEVYIAQITVKKNTPSNKYISKKITRNPKLLKSTCNTNFRYGTVPSSPAFLPSSISQLTTHPIFQSQFYCYSTSVALQRNNLFSKKF